MDALAYLRFFLALVLVLGLILALAWGLKRLGLGDGARGPLARRRRLRTVESIMIDGRHKAVLLRRDDVEHLVLVGPNTSQIIERAIPAPATDALTTDAAPAGLSFRSLLSREPQP
jgi:flagellar protein FliO/FliZ